MGLRIIFWGWADVHEIIFERFSLILGLPQPCCFLPIQRNDESFWFRKLWKAQSWEGGPPHKSDWALWKFIGNSESSASLTGVF